MYLTEAREHMIETDHNEAQECLETEKKIDLQRRSDKVQMTKGQNQKIILRIKLRNESKQKRHAEKQIAIKAKKMMVRSDRPPPERQ